MASRLSRYGPAVVAWLLLIGVTGTFYSLVIPGILKEFKVIGALLTAGEAILLLGVIVNFFMATVMDPGILPKATESEEQQQDEFRAPLHKNVEVRGISIRMKWCSTCHFYRPPRCSHCSICDHCIDTFDHHCPWLNNCIGRRNYRQFFIFLILLSLHIVFVFVLCLFYTLNRKDNLLTKENLGSMVVMVLGGMLFVPIIGLTGFHVFLVVTGRTTNEQVTGKFRSGHNPFNKGICRNVAFICCGPQFPKVVSYADRRETTDIELLPFDKAGNSGAVEATSPLLQGGIIPAGGHRPKVIAAASVDAAHVHLRSVDEAREPLTSKRQLRDGKFPEPKRPSGDNVPDSRLVMSDDTLVADRSRGSLASRSRSSGGEQHSDEMSISHAGTNDMSGASLSRDSSLVTVRVFPKSGSVGFTQMPRLGDAEGGGMPEAQGSKCNLLDETGSAFGVPGVIQARRFPDASDTSADNISYQSQQQDAVSSPGNERYQQALREAYSGAVYHKPPMPARSSTRPVGKNVPNGPEWSPYGVYNQTVNTQKAFSGGDAVQRFAYVPPSAILESSVVNKSQSMDALGHQAEGQSSSPHHGYPPTPPRLTLAPTLSSSVADYNNYAGYKRPLSFTQAVQLHDSLSRLNSTRTAQGAPVPRPRSDTAGSQQAGNVSEIRV